jgi:hypothetical protein
MEGYSMTIYYTNCCGAVIRYPDDRECDLCPDCGEWAELIPEDEDDENITVDQIIEDKLEMEVYND